MCDSSKTVPLLSISDEIPNNCALIGCLSFESRSLCVPQIVASKVSKMVMFKNEELHCNSIQKNAEEVSKQYPSGRIQSVSFKKTTELADSMAKVVEELSKACDNLLIDVTTFTHESLVMLLKIVHSFRGSFKSILCVYVGAEQYSPGMKAEDAWLSKGCKDVRNVIGFPGLLRPIEKTSLVILAGFEMERATRLIELIEPDSLILGNGIDPTNKNHSDKMAYFQGKFRIWQSEFKNIENSSFDFSCRDIKHTIQQIKGIISQRPNDNYILVPLNTKLSTIAATLVGIENRRIQLCYAIPEIYNVNNYAMPGDNATIVDLFEFQEFK